MHTHAIDTTDNSPRHDRAAAIRNSVLSYAYAHGLNDEQADRCAGAAVDAYTNGDSAAWAISVGKGMVTMERAGVVLT